MSVQIENDDVADLVAECLVGRPNYLSPAEDQVSKLTRRINHCLKHPWTAEEVARLRQEAKKQREEEKDMRSVAALFESDLERLVKDIAGYEPGTMMRNALDSRLKDLNGAIRLLREPRGFLGTSGLTVHLNTGPNGKDPAPWRLTAANIAIELIQTLRSCGDHLAGIGEEDGPVVKFVEQCFLHWPELIAPVKVRNRSLIREAIVIHLAPALKYSSRGG